jgi:stearoyl-CoA desaturase (delta-9 desaturase)
MSQLTEELRTSLEEPCSSPGADETPMSPQAEELPPAEESRFRTGTEESETRLVDLVFAFAVTFLPPLAFVLAGVLWALGLHTPGLIELAVMAVMHVLCVVGVELGFHRLFSHRSYKPARGLKIALACLGSMAFQGPAIWWASIHRKHHNHSDQPGDPHSMYVFDPEGRWTFRGAVHAHIGWIWTGRSVGKGGFARYANDLYRDRDVFWIHMHYFYFLLAGFALPALAAGLAYGSWQGAASGLLWGGFIRVFVMNHLTYWCINSVTHGVGHRDYETNDHSTNVPLLALVTLGQSWHNNHHAFPASAVMNHKPLQLDPGAWILHTFRRLGLVRDMVLPRPDMLDRRRRIKE